MKNKTKKEEILEKSTVIEDEYGDDSMTTLDFHSHIRLRYGMYLGTYPADHMVSEVLDNSVDEHMNGYGDIVYITLNVDTNTCTVEDYGRGIPIGINPKTKLPNLQMAFHSAHTGGKFGDNNAFKVSGGLNGTGLKGVCALSEYLRAESERNNNRVAIEFSKGTITKKFHKTKAIGHNGTTVIFSPDSDLLSKDDKYIINAEKLLNSCKLRAYLNKTITINLTIIENEIPTNNIYHFENGLLDYIDEVAPNKLFNMQPILLENSFDHPADGKPNTNTYEICFAYDEKSMEEQILSFSNGVTNSKGTHESGFKFALTNIMNDYISNNNLLPKKHSKLKISGNDIRKGLVCIINAKVCNAEFTGQVKDELGNPEVRSDIIALMKDKLTTWINEHPKEIKLIAERIVKLAIATENIKEVQNKIIQVAAKSSGLSFSSKFINCESRDPNLIEVYVVEGESAAGSVRKGRDGKYQCVYSLKGKIKNTYNSSQKDILDSLECNELLKIIFGHNDIKNIDYDKDIRINKLIITVDADDDGKHIMSLLLLLFGEHTRPLLEKGIIYIACSPLYRILVNNKPVYFRNQKEFDKYKANYISKRYSLDMEELTVKDIIEKEDEYYYMFNTKLKNKYSLTDDIISMILSQGIDETAEWLDEQNLEVTFDENTNLYSATGLLENDWIDIEFTDNIIKEINELKSIYGVTKLKVMDNKTNENYICDIIDALNLFNSEFKFHRYRFKGLGEINPKELKVTTIDPKTRDIIQVLLKPEDNISDMNNVLFGNNPDLRKEFIKENNK